MRGAPHKVASTRARGGEDARLLLRVRLACVLHMCLRHRGRLSLDIVTSTHQDIIDTAIECSYSTQYPVV